MLTAARPALTPSTWRYERYVQHMATNARTMAMTKGPSAKLIIAAACLIILLSMLV